MGNMKQAYLEKPKLKPTLLVVKSEPNQALVEQLERLLKNAKNGEIRGYFCVCSWKEDVVTHGWVIPDVQYGLRRMIGEIQLMMQRLTNFIIDDEYEGL